MRKSHILLLYYQGSHSIIGIFKRWNNSTSDTHALPPLEAITPAIICPARPKGLAAIAPLTKPENAATATDLQLTSPSNASFIFYHTLCNVSIFIYSHDSKPATIINLFYNYPSAVDKGWQK